MGREARIGLLDKALMSASERILVSRACRMNARPVPRQRPTIRPRRRLRNAFGEDGEEGTTAGEIVVAATFCPAAFSSTENWSATSAS